MALATVTAVVAVTAALDGGSRTSPRQPSVRPLPDLGARPWFDTGLPAERRVEALLAEMTLDEKVSRMYGVDTEGHTKSAGFIPGIARLGLPDLVLSDGPAGVRDSASRGGKPRPSTALPAPIALAATFDTDLAGRYGEILGREARARDVDVLYAPAVNLVRVPQGGRNFEYLGEDPFLASALVGPEVRGIQRHGVAAQVKHFAANNQEKDRHTTSSQVDQRTLRELYLPAFRAAVTDGGARSVMCANNKVNGVHACEHRTLLTGILREEWGFEGVVGSDYGATHSAAGSVNAGLDQSFHQKDWGRYYRDLPDVVRRGEVSESAIDRSVRRILGLMVAIGAFDGARRPAVDEVDFAGHARLARRMAEAGTVLLKNDGGLLPLDPARLRSVAVVGPYAATAYTGGGGSSRVTPLDPVSPVEGLRARLGPEVAVTTASGRDERQAAKLARAADVAIVVAGDTGRESRDRKNLALDDGGDDLIEAVVKANPRTIVVLNTSGPVTMPWLASVPALLEAWYPGQEHGHALASVLTGDVNPSGKLPVTFPKSLSQGPTAEAPRYPAKKGVYRYSEGLEVGYRWYDAQRLAPLFPFGFGLSYTTFELSDLRLESAPGGAVAAHFRITNTGTRAGTETPQVYVGPPASAGAPPRALAGFTKVTLGSGAAQDVSITVPAAAFTRWDTSERSWADISGSFSISVGTSSRSLALTSRLDR